MVIMADKAVIKFDMEKGFAHVYLDGANIASGTGNREKHCHDQRPANS